MNKDELVQAVSAQTHASRKTAESVVNAALESIGEALEREERVTIIGFGTFAVRERPAREGRNPRTGEALQIPARKIPVFIPGRGLKAKLGIEEESKV